ncbi:MAG: DUF554 domain-containing protein [Fimbriimonadaceae bacterium]|nr:DUF554 domain-containing protein [Fimbriimonadaceae bacterium]
MRGTLLNTGTVAGGSLIGLALGSRLPSELLTMALTGLGLVTIGIGLKMVLGARNLLVVAASVAIGGVLGRLIGIEAGLAAFGDWSKGSLGALGTGRFTEAIVTTSVLFCVGPMTILGCIQDAVEKKIELLALKSVMDGVASVFLAALLGPGVLVTAAIVLVVQGTITLLARYLRPIAENPALLSDTVASGGVMLTAIGFGLADIKKIPSGDYLPALALAVLFGWVAVRFEKGAATNVEDAPV